MISILIRVTDVFPIVVVDFWLNVDWRLRLWRKVRQIKHHRNSELLFTQCRYNRKLILRDVADSDLIFLVSLISFVVELSVALGELLLSLISFVLEFSVAIGELLLKLPVSVFE